MSGEHNRRRFLTTLVGGAAGLSLSPAAVARLSAAAGEGASLNVTELGSSLFEVTGAGGNVVVALGPDGLIMVNGGLPERSAALLKLVASRAGGTRVQTLVNLDWHPENTGSNDTLGRAGTTILAHENTKQYIAADRYADWQKRSYKSLPAAALPTKTFYGPGKMTVGAEQIEYAHLGQAHTDGAIFVYFKTSNVLMVGDALSVGTYPIPDYTAGGWLGGLINANKALLAIANADTRIVPGAGPLQTRAALQAQHDMLAAMYERFLKMMKQGMGPDDMVAAAPSKDFDAQWGQSNLFVSTAYRSMWLHVRELGGIV